MSQHPLIQKVRFAASFRATHKGLWTLTVFALGLALPAAAQNPPATHTVPERHFTVPPYVPTAVVVQTEPDAACDLHAAGVNNPSQSMRFYGNSEGYVRFHFTPLEDVQDAYLQLDCTAGGVVTTHPVHLRVAAFSDGGHARAGAFHTRTRRVDDPACAYG